jgi:hypothetical protein
MAVLRENRALRTTEVREGMPSVVWVVPVSGKEKTVGFTSDHGLYTHPGEPAQLPEELAHFFAFLTDIERAGLLDLPLLATLRLAVPAQHVELLRDLRAPQSKLLRCSPSFMNTSPRSSGHFVTIQRPVWMSAWRAWPLRLPWWPRRTRSPKTGANTNTNGRVSTFGRARAGHHRYPAVSAGFPASCTSTM